MDIIELEMESQCVNKSGKPVSILRIDPDPPGIVGAYLQYGNPYSVDGSTVHRDEDALLTYLDLMSDIDLSDDDNLAAIGFDALTEARTIASQVLWASSGIEETTKRQNGERVVFVDDNADGKVRGTFGHVINPEVGGQSLDQLKRMSFADVNSVIGMVNASNMILRKAQKSTDSS